MNLKGFVYIISLCMVQNELDVNITISLSKYKNIPFDLLTKRSQQNCISFSYE